MKEDPGIGVAWFVIAVVIAFFVGAWLVTGSTP